MIFHIYDERIIEKRYQDNFSYDTIDKNLRIAGDGINKMRQELFWDDLKRYHSGQKTQREFSIPFQNLINSGYITSNNNLTTFEIKISKSNFIRINYCNGIGLVYIILPFYKDADNIAMEFKSTFELNAMHCNGYNIEDTGILSISTEGWRWKTKVNIKKGQFWNESFNDSRELLK